MRARASASWVPLLVATVVGSIVLALVESQFATSYNGFVIFQSAAEYALIGFAAMVVLAVRDLSLAVGGIGSLSAVLFGWLVQEQGVALLVAVVLTVALGALAGLFNGVVIAVSKLSGFIVTLATGAAMGGLALGLTRSAAYTRIPSSWTGFGQHRVGFLPLTGVVAIVVALLLYVMYRWTAAGRAMLTMGGNPEAALLSGIRISRQLVLGHTLSGVMAAVAALLAIARIGSAPPDLGSPWVLIAFAVPIIGGTALTGGRVSVIGALVAAVVLAVIDDALILLNVSQYGVVFAQGVLVLTAILLGNAGSWRLRTRRVSEGVA